MTCEFYKKCKKYKAVDVCTDAGAEEYFKWHSTQNRKHAFIRCSYCPYYSTLRDVVIWEEA